MVQLDSIGGKGQDGCSIFDPGGVLGAREVAGHFSAAHLAQEARGAAAELELLGCAQPPASGPGMK